MPYAIVVRLLLCGLLLAAIVGVPARALAAADPAGETAAPVGVLEVFVREGCPHCADAKRFLAELAVQRPALAIVYREVDRDPAARDALIEISRQAGAWPPGVPTFVFGAQVLVGFDDGEHIGADLLRLLDEAAPRAPPDTVESGLFGTLRASELGLPLFTLAIGLLDGFNPCAMWVLLFLLSLLLRLKERRRMVLVAGTFVLASGAVYYAFMAAWLNVFLFVGMTEALRVGLAGLAMLIGFINVKDFFAFRRGVSLSIPEAAKPGLYARARAILKAESLPGSLAAVAALAVVVNFVELLCTAGLPAIYTAVLTQHDLSPLAHYGYLGLYILAYIADDALMVGAAVLALGSGKLDERGGRRLKLVSGAVMLALGLVMLLRPQWLM
ncbi:MAG TPA: glutaredoxin family protein [Thauera sp.]|uniref:glutaredoxin family protein n=1 Tax=Thauera sp. TaxID=1905334 RepID=UPI002CC99FD5|nr:glutaredoxin family protein [Thauera sp.]HRP26281.1 glutaredoxin family protein [Thauera sp.]HRP67702.1 glutaredoxin family protein [Thauera sp.]